MWTLASGLRVVARGARAPLRRRLFASAAAQSEEGAPPTQATHPAVQEQYEELRPKLLFGHKASVRQLNAFLEKCIDHSDPSLVEHALERFRAGDMKTNVKTASLVIKLFGQQEQPQQALRVIRNRVQYGLFPSSTSYAKLMTQLLRQRQHGDAVSCFELACRDGVVNSDLFGLAVTAQARSKGSSSYEKLSSLVSAATSNGIQLPPRAWSHAIQHHLSRGHGDEALAAVRQFETQWSQGQDHRHLAAARQVIFGQEVRAHLLRGDLSKAVRAFEKFKTITDLQVLPTWTTQKLHWAVQDAKDEHNAALFKSVLDHAAAVKAKVPSLNERPVERRAAGAADSASDGANQTEKQGDEAKPAEENKN